MTWKKKIPPYERACLFLKIFGWLVEKGSASKLWEEGVGGLERGAIDFFLFSKLHLVACHGTTQFYIVIIA